MGSYDKILYALCFGLFIAGLRIIFMWGHTSKLIGLGLIFLSLSTAYIIHKKVQKIKVLALDINRKNILLGLFLIIVDLTYNIISSDALRSFDYGMLLSGLVIIILNSNIHNFLKLDKEMVNFISYFLFVLLIAIGFLGTGITFINNYIHGESLPNPIYTLMTNLTLKSSSFVLNLIKTTNLTENVIDFDGFRVGISYPCSGIESLTVFVSSIIAYFIAKKEKDLKRITIITLIGIIFLYILNIIRIVIIILVGYSFGDKALHFTHNNLGWIIFVIGMALFWYLILGGKDKNAES